MSLLQEAASTEHGSQDPTILDHYGDALWLAGRAAEAAHHWQLAQNYSSRMLRPATGAPEAISPTDAAAAEYRDIIARAAAKRQLMGSGQWVPVAPQARNPRPTPPPTAAPPTGVPDPAAKPEVGATGARPATAG